MMHIFAFHNKCYFQVECDDAVVEVQTSEFTLPSDHPSGDTAGVPTPLHAHCFHGLTPNDVLQGDLAIQTLDYISTLLKAQYDVTHGCLPPSYIYSIARSEQPLHTAHQIPPEVRAVQIHWVSAAQCNSKTGSEHCPVRYVVAQE